MDTDTLSKTRKFLRGTPRTAAEVAEHFGISKVVAYERLEQLRLLGDARPSKKAKGPTGKTGPKAWMWVAV